MEYIVTDEQSLKEAAAALGFGIIKKPKMIKIKPCSECGIRHHRTEKRSADERIFDGWYTGKRGVEIKKYRINRHVWVRLYCSTCGKDVSKEFETGRNYHISADQENEIRKMWNDIN